MGDGSRHLDLPRGFHDSDPSRTATYEVLRRDWFAACSLFGYQPVEAPPVGFHDTFTRGHHAAGNRLYPFADRSGRSLSLVSDSLPAVLRLAKTRRLRMQRLSYCCPVFRYVRRPRRYFHHLGLMEVVSGSMDLAAQYRSTERLARIMAIFLTPRLAVRFTLTDPGLWRDLTDNVASSQGSKLLDALRRHPAAERPALLRAAGCAPAAIRVAHLLTEDPAMSSDDVTGALAEHQPRTRDRVDRVRALADVVRQCGATAEIDLGCLHASEFHDGPSFLVSPMRGRLLGDGGAYSAFASAFVGAATSVYSAIIGLERLADLEGCDRPSVADVAVIAHADSASVAHAEVLTGRLRDTGIRVWDLVQTERLGRLLRDVASVGIPFVVVVGENELQSELCVVRDDCGSLHTVCQRDLPGWLASRTPGSAVAAHDVEQR